MTTYNEVINIKVNDAGIVKANESLQTLKSNINTINGTPIKINFKGADSFNSVVKGYKNLINTINKGDASGINKVIKQVNSLQSTVGKNMQLNIKEGNITSVISSIDRLSKEIKELTSLAKSVDLSGIGKGNGQLEKTNSELKKLNTILNEVKANSKLNIQVNYSGTSPAQVRQSAVRATGHNHTGNYFGFYADDSPLYQYGSALKQTTRRMQMASEKINLVGTNLAMFASYAGVKEMTDIMIETPAKAEVQRYLLSEMQGDNVTHDVKNVTGKGVGAEATLYEQLDKMTDKLPISMQNVVQPLYAWNSANGNNPDDLSRAISSMSNFGAQVLNMTGSEERAQTAMEKLSYAFNGQFQAVDQYGISEKSMEKHGFKKDWQGDVEHIEDFWNAVDEITGDATKSMHNFNGMKATVSKDFSRSGKKIWNNFLGPLATTGLSAFHEFDSAFGGIPTQLLAVGSAGLSMATTLTMLIGSAGTAVGAFSEATASFRVLRKNGGGLKEFFKVFSASSFNELNRYGYGGHYGNAYSGYYGSPMVYTGGGGNATPVEMPFVPVDTDGTPLPTVADPKKTGSKVKQKAYETKINKQRKTELESIKKTTRTRFGEYAKTYKANRKYNNMIKENARSLGLVNGGLKKTLMGLPSWVGYGTALLGAFAGFKIIKGIWDEAYNRNERVRAATDRMNTAWDKLSSSITKGVGNILGNALYHGEYQGSGTFDKIMEDVANNTAKILEIINGDTPYQQEAEKKSEGEQYGWKEGDTDALKETKKEAIENIKWWSNLQMGNAHFWDKIFGTNTEGKIKAEREEAITAVQGGDLSAGNYGFYGKGKTGFGLLGDTLHRNFYNELFDRELKSTGVDWRDSGGSLKENYKRYLQEKVLGIPNDEVIEPVTTEDWIQFGREWGKGNTWENPITHRTYNDDLMDKYDKKRGERSNEPSSTDKIMEQYDKKRGERARENAGQPKIPEFDLGKVLTNTSLFNMFGLGGTPVSAASGSGGGGGADTAPIVDGWFNSIKQNLETKSPELGTSLQTSLTNSFNTMDMTLVGTSLATNLNTSIQNGLTATPLDLSGFFAGITSQLNSHNAEFNTSGNTAGTQYTTGFGTGIGGASGTASAEAGEILSALDISAEAYSLGAAAGKAFHEGFESNKGADINSPGKAARDARDESNYILGFMQSAVRPIYSTAREMGSSMATGFAYDSNLGYSNSTFGSVKKENTAGYVMSSTTGSVNHITQNFNIAKIDSKDRAKEVAEFAVKMVKWNNETAGRATEV